SNPARDLYISARVQPEPGDNAARAVDHAESVMTDQEPDVITGGKREPVRLSRRCDGIDLDVRATHRAAGAQTATHLLIDIANLAVGARQEQDRAYTVSGRRALPLFRHCPHSSLLPDMKLDVTTFRVGGECLGHLSGGERNGRLSSPFFP